MRILDLHPLLTSSTPDLDPAIRRIAVIFDQSQLHTTGGYVARALKRRCEVQVFDPREINTISASFDLYLVVDDGSHYVFPDRLHPSALWIIDTHLSFSYDIVMATNFDYIFCAQRRGAEGFIRLGFANVAWLPLACDPEIHGGKKSEKRYDVGFVGQLGTGRRREILTQVKARYPNSYIGRAEYLDIGHIYAESHVVLNVSIQNDLNMRVFEGLCSGSAVITDQVDGIDELLTADKEVFVYRSLSELFTALEYLLHDAGRADRDRVAQTGYATAVRSHTYACRVDALLETIVSNAARPHKLPPLLRITATSPRLKNMMLGRRANRLFMSWFKQDWLRAMLRSRSHLKSIKLLYHLKDTLRMKLPN